MAKLKIRHGFRYFKSGETRLDTRYPVWMEGRTICTDPMMDSLGGEVPCIRVRRYPIPDEYIENGMITRQKLMKFLNSIHEPVPEDVLPDIIVIDE